MIQLLSAVGYLHMNYHTHAHLSPDHIIICKPKHRCVKILNLCLPRVQVAGGANNFRAGNPCYWSLAQGICFEKLIETHEDAMKPNFETGTECVDLGKDTDMYSLGLIFLEMCYGFRFWVIASSQHIILEFTQRHERAKLDQESELKMKTKNYCFMADVIKRLLSSTRMGQYDCYQALGELISVRDRFFEANGSAKPDFWMDFFDPRKPENELKVLNNLGVGFYLMEMPGQAQKYFEKCLALNRQVEVTDEICLYNYAAYGKSENHMDEMFVIRC